jgi:hypothetical protein
MDIGAYKAKFFKYLVVFVAPCCRQASLCTS